MTVTVTVFPPGNKPDRQSWPDMRVGAMAYLLDWVKEMDNQSQPINIP